MKFTPFSVQRNIFRRRCKAVSRFSNLQNLHSRNLPIFAIYRFHNLRCRNLQISQSVDFAISRFHNLEISESPDCKSQIAIFGICADVQLTWDDVCTRCRMCLSHGTPGSQDVPHDTCDDMCHNQCHGAYKRCHMIRATRHELCYMCVHVWGSCQA